MDNNIIALFLRSSKCSDVNPATHLFESLGSAIFRPIAWDPGVHTDCISFDETVHSKEFQGFKITRI